MESYRKFVKYSDCNRFIGNFIISFLKSTKIRNKKELSNRHYYEMIFVDLYFIDIC